MFACAMHALSSVPPARPNAVLPQEDGNDKVEFSEFVDGLATNLVTPCPVWDRVVRASKDPSKNQARTPRAHVPGSPRDTMRMESPRR